MAFKKLIAPRRGEPVVDGEGRASRRMTEYLEHNATLVNQKRTEIVELGDWNMGINSFIEVVHGLVYEDIIAAEALIRNDADTLRYSIGSGLTVTNTAPQGYVGAIDSTKVNIARLTGGRYDHVDYSTTSYNRGWLIITYINQ